MHKKVADTTSPNALGIAPEKKLLRIESGPYAGRRVAVVLTAAGEIKYTYSDAPKTVWAPLTTVVSDAADHPFDCVLDESGNIHVVYIEDATSYLVAKKLTLADGDWSVGSKVVIYSGDPSANPSLAVESGGTLWVSWTKETDASYYVNIKSSENSGLSWGSGPSDAGQALTAGGTSAYSKVLVGAISLHVVYTLGNSEISHRSKPLTGSTWSSAFNIATGSGFDGDFDASVSPGGMLGVVFDCGELKYREFDGSSWSALVLLDAAGGDRPQLIFTGNVPTAVYLAAVGDDQVQLTYTIRKHGAFSASAPLDMKAKAFDAAVLYSNVYSSYENVTNQCANPETADIYHSSSNVLAKAVGDVVYVGMTQPFRFLRILLSVVGVGGAVVYAYWDGSAWRAFTPHDGNYHLDTSDKELRLWENYGAIPNDWQKRYVEESLCYWLKIETSSAFTTGPVGSRITAISDINALSVRR
ncbi:MAG: hypothetical protein OEW00_08325 [candidate division Zixibacteria bacterium]|nr:hypothetical protein [candidate division Zixibacteria bacterium]